MAGVRSQSRSHGMVWGQGPSTDPASLGMPSQPLTGRNFSPKFHLDLPFSSRKPFPVSWRSRPLSKVPLQLLEPLSGVVGSFPSPGGTPPLCPWPPLDSRRGPSVQSQCPAQFQNVLGATSGQRCHRPPPPEPPSSVRPPRRRVGHRQPPPAFRVPQHSSQRDLFRDPGAARISEGIPTSPFQIGDVLVPFLLSPGASPKLPESDAERLSRFLQASPRLLHQTRGQRGAPGPKLKALRGAGTPPHAV